MPILHVRNVPEELYETIRRQAESQKRSLSQQVIHLLEKAVIEDRFEQAKILMNIRQRQSFSPEKAGAPNSTELLREDRNR